jgi:formylglycine-generating enzyme required for sulfatase activity
MISAFFDMHGNVWNWTLSRARPYPQGKVSQVFEDAEETELHITPNRDVMRLRGGPFDARPSGVRCADRVSEILTHSNGVCGIRVARTIR